MQPGRSYLVWASGVFHIDNALITVELDAFHETDTITLFGDTHHSFALAVGTTLPPDEDLFTVAKVSAAIRDVLDDTQPAEVAAEAARLAVLAVDSVSVLAG
jgi:hypothetical protein